MKAPPPVVAENGLVAAVPSAGVWFICGAADIGWRPTALIFVLNLKKMLIFYCLE